MNTLVPRLLVVTSLVCATLVAAAPPAHGQVLIEEASLDLTLKKTHIKTAAYGLFLSMTPKEVFFPTAIACPGSTPCVVQVQLAMKADAVVPEDDFMVAVTVDGTQVMHPGHIYGGGFLPLIRAHGAEADVTQAMTWVATVIPGTHEIGVQVRMLLGQASVGARTMTVSVFK